jgi:hypothetical protein
MAIPIKFIESSAAYESVRPEVTFSAHEVFPRGRVSVHAANSQGWVFDINLTGRGTCTERAIEVTGGTVEYGHGFSGDESRVDFEIVHDGVSSEIIVSYNIRPD